ncbi:MAG: NADH-quinone oxidoreductase subunit K [Fibrobacterota bacterium]
MSCAPLPLLWAAGIFTVLLLFIGFYCILATRNLIRILIGIEVLSKGITLGIIAVGYAVGNMALAQSLAITVIIVEVFVVAIAAGIIINLNRHHGSVSARNIENLKG